MAYEEDRTLQVGPEPVRANAPVARLKRPQNFGGPPPSNQRDTEAAALHGLGRVLAPGGRLFSPAACDPA
ncbi:hypothetical protein GCM10010339_87510 [Streptomyces alanosinicus]|uniref:Uncharacterized protein n=1 Tax=Streptomyces alanosinicus TaxID=68171 RepID=A0A918YSM2_9ACTN|nr:hypothetical protein GCM10010339_87510 [Streptomyces alanosinicus]